VYDSLHAKDYVQSFMDLLSPIIQHKDEVTIVVTYRAPKMDHVTSTWKQYLSAYNATLSFREFLTSDLVLENMKWLNSLDSLYAAKVLAVDNDINVVLMDSSGTQKRGYDISNVAACQILGLPCHIETMTPIFGGNVSMQNVRPKNASMDDLTLEEKSQIESILQKLDCNSIHFLFDHPRVRILHPYLLQETRNLCENKAIYSHADVIKDIRWVVS